MIMIEGCRSSFLLTASFMGTKNKLGLSILEISNYSRGGGREEGFLSYIEITDPLDDLF